MPRARASVSGLRTDNGENWDTPDECKFWKRDDAMHMLTWWNATRKQLQGNNSELLKDTWHIGLGALQHSTTTRGSRPEI